MIAEKTDAEFIAKLRAGPIGAQLEKESETARLAGKRAAIAAYDKIRADSDERLRQAQAAYDAITPRLAAARKALAAIQDEVSQALWGIDAERGAIDRNLQAARGEIARHVNPKFQDVCKHLRDEIEQVQKLKPVLELERGPSDKKSRFFASADKQHSTKPSILARVAWLQAGMSFVCDLAISELDDCDETLRRAEEFIMKGAPLADRMVFVWRSDNGERDWHSALRKAIDDAQSDAIRAFEASSDKFLKSERDRAKNEGKQHA